MFGSDFSHNPSPCHPLRFMLKDLKRPAMPAPKPKVKAKAKAKSRGNKPRKGAPTEKPAVSKTKKPKRGKGQGKRTDEDKSTGAAGGEALQQPARAKKPCKGRKTTD